MKIIDEDTWQILGLAAGFIAVFLLACFALGSCIDRCSRNEDRASREPVQQNIPFKK
jgi:hypothetical protein